MSVGEFNQFVLLLQKMLENKFILYWPAKLNINGNREVRQPFDHLKRVTLLICHFYFQLFFDVTAMIGEDAVEMSDLLFQAYCVSFIILEYKAVDESVAGVEDVCNQLLNLAASEKYGNYLCRMLLFFHYYKQPNPFHTLTFCQ